jgi:hypothetical protein
MILGLSSPFANLHRALPTSISVMDSKPFNLASKVAMVLTTDVKRPLDVAGKVIGSFTPDFPPGRVPANIFSIIQQFPVFRVLGLIAVLLSAWLFTHMYKLRNDTPLKDVPGPWLASCSPLYRFWYAVVKGDFHNHLTNLHRRYGDVVRIAPNEVSIWDPKAVSEIYAFGDKGYAKCDM